MHSHYLTYNIAKLDPEKHLVWAPAWITVSVLKMKVSFVMCPCISTPCVIASLSLAPFTNALLAQIGIVPRCIIELFQILKAREAQDQDFKYEIYVSFLELYNEEFIDLLNNPQQQSKRRSTSSQQNLNATANSNPNEVSIREDIAGNIYWSGVKEELCYSPEELLG